MIMIQIHSCSWTQEGHRGQTGVSLSEGLLLHYFDYSVSLTWCHIFLILSYRVQAEQMVSRSNIFSLGGLESAHLKGETRGKKGGVGWGWLNPQSFGTDQLSDLLSSLLADRQEWKDWAGAGNRQPLSNREPQIWVGLISNHWYVAFTFHRAFVTKQNR